MGHSFYEFLFDKFRFRDWNEFCGINWDPSLGTMGLKNFLLLFWLR